MSQDERRARFISEYNLPNQHEGDLIKVQLWLKQNRWPADEMVDAFMQYMKDANPSECTFEFNTFMTLQYDFVRDHDPVAWDFLCEKWLANEDFRRCMSNELKEYLAGNVRG